MLRHERLRPGGKMAAPLPGGASAQLSGAPLWPARSERQGKPLPLETAAR